MTSAIWAAISLVGASITVCKALFKSIFSNAITVKTAVLPVPDFASRKRSANKNQPCLVTRYYHFKQSYTLFYK